MTDRKQKLDEILTILKDNNGKITFKELYGKTSSKYGTSTYTFWGYLNSLDAAGEINLPGGYLTAKEDEIEISLAKTQ